MAFQDSTYGIVLDAVLTDAGRKRMANGNFSISKFCLGDDEIDYALYVTASGADPEDDSKIMETPIMEAFAGQNANINYGLQNFVRTDILYYPTIKANPLLNESAVPHTDGFYYFATNKETMRKLDSHFGNARYVLQNNKLDQTKMVFESGIDNEDVSPTALNKERFITNMGLYDKYYLIYCDNRFFEKILISRNDAIFENDIGDNLYMNLEPLQDSIEISLSTIGDNFSCYRVSAINNDVLDSNYTSTAGNTYSNISGPRSSIFALNLKVKNELTSDSAADFKYTKFGQTSNAILGGSDLYDFIDTTIYIQGLSSGARLTVPIRVMRYAGA
tara:strand:- start:1366 stop:2361 length:996 start_codon:yes stop_codon:yes gene_type:complete